MSLLVTLCLQTLGCPIITVQEYLTTVRSAPPQIDEILHFKLKFPEDRQPYYNEVDECDYGPAAGQSPAGQLYVLLPPHSCQLDAHYRVVGPGRVEGTFWKLPGVVAGKLRCYVCLANSVTIAPLLLASSAQSVMLARAETLTQPNFGSQPYWQLRAR